MPDDRFCGNCGCSVPSANEVFPQNPPNVNTVPVEPEPDDDIWFPSQPSASDQDDLSGFTGRSDGYETTPSGYGYDDDTPTYPGNNGFYDPPAKTKNAVKSVLIAVISTLLALLVLFTVFNVLIMTDTVDTSNVEFLEEYKETLKEFLHLPQKPEEKAHEDQDEHNEETTKIEEETTTEPATQPTTTAQTPETTQDVQSNNGIPAELQQYASGLVAEGKTYLIKLRQDDWNINYRSSPQLIDKDQPNNNIVGKIKSGSQIYVEYIYNGTWAVFYKDGHYVFASLFAQNDPSQNRLMEVM